MDEWRLGPILNTKLYIFIKIFINKIFSLYILF